MARKKAARDSAEDAWAYYRSIQLTPEQKAAARAEAEKVAEEAFRNGVYERALALIGNLHLDREDLEELRKDRD
jgi:hypothetical protein